MSFKTTATLMGAFAATAMAHGTVMSFKTDGKDNGGFLLDYYYEKANGGEMTKTAGWYAENLDNGFVEPNSFGKPDIICHKNAEPAPISATVAAGGKVEFQWSEWPESHMGPVLTYVAKCDGDCADADKTTLKWVKIDEAGYNAETESWAAIDLIADNNTWTTTVPETLAAGNYVFRHEIIALHGAGSENGAQAYPQCVNIEITGGGSDNPEGVLGTELYKADDAGILFDPYSGTIDYQIPGPKLYGPGSGSETPSPVAPTPTPIETPIETPIATPTPTPTPTPGAFNAKFVARPQQGAPAPARRGADALFDWLQARTAGVARRHARQF